MLKKVLMKASQIWKKHSDRSNRVTTSYLEKDRRLEDLKDVEFEVSNPYGNHVGAVQIDVFDKGLFISYDNGKDKPFTTFIKK